MGKSTKSQKGLCIWMWQYFVKLGVSRSFTKTMQLLFNVGSEETDRGYHTRFKQDRLPQHLFDPKHDLLSYFENTLYYKLKEKNGGDFGELYAILYNSLQLLTGDDCDYTIPDRLKKSSSIALDSLIDYVKRRNSSIDINSSIFFAQHLYSVIYFFGKGFCPPSKSDEIFQLADCRTELMERVILPFGLSTKPGMYQVIKLAEEGNPLALYECSGLYYYGIICPEPNYQKSFDYCLRAIKATPPAPIAFWDYGYMLYNYKRPGTELENAFIAQLEYMDPIDRIRLAISYEHKAAACGIVAAFNVLGNMANDPNVPMEIKKEFNLTDPEKLWKKAADNNYVFSLGNLSELYEQRALKEENPEKKKELMDLSFDYLIKAADQYGAWANNTLGLKYYKKNQFPEAYNHFSRAKTVDYIWGYYNLLEKYHLPSYLTGNSPSYLDKEIKIEDLIKVCINAKNQEVAERTKDLLKNHPELLK